jgi:thiol-disulfide isomerase/thioredoxin
MTRNPQDDGRAGRWHGSISMAAALLAFCSFAGAAAAGGAAPDFRAVSTTADTLQLSSFRGRVVVVDFWATWCPPCRNQLERLSALEREVPEIVVLAVNVDSRRDKLGQYLKRVQAPRRVLLDPTGHIAARYGAQGMPWTVLVDRRGDIVSEHAGGDEGGFAELAASARRLARTSGVEPAAMRATTGAGR